MRSRHVRILAVAATVLLVGTLLPTGAAETVARCTGDSVPVDEPSERGRVKCSVAGEDASARCYVDRDGGIWDYANDVCYGLVRATHEVIKEGVVSEACPDHCAYAVTTGEDPVILGGDENPDDSVVEVHVSSNDKGEPYWWQVSAGSDQLP